MTDEHAHKLWQLARLVGSIDWINELRKSLAAGASEGQAEPVACTTETDLAFVEKGEMSTMFPVGTSSASVNLYLHPSAELTALRERIAGMEKDAERMKDLCKTLANIMQDQTVAMQSAVIEWEFGKGAEAGLGWIVNTLEGPGNLPDPDAEHGKNAQFWFSANCAEPMPKCFCGNPSNTLWMGQGFCCNEHYREAKAKYDAAIAKQDKEQS